MNPELIFEIATPLGFIVRCTRAYWEFIVTQKHPALTGREQDIRRFSPIPTRYGAAAWIGPCTSSIGEVRLAGFVLSRAARTGLAS